MNIHWPSLSTGIWNRKDNTRKNRNFYQCKKCGALNNKKTCSFCKAIKFQN